VTEDLEEPDHGDVAHVGEKMGPFPLKVIAPQPEHLEIGGAEAQVMHELSGVQVAGGLATRDEHAGRGGHGEAV
jgi:hypothetical protein